MDSWRVGEVAKQIAGLTEPQKKVLEALDYDPDVCLPFAPLCEETGLSRKEVRLACRALARKGLARFARGLWTEDGEPAGSGYGITRAAVAALTNCEGQKDG